jgi:hypothetical protein
MTKLRLAFTVIACACSLCLAGQETKGVLLSNDLAGPNNQFSVLTNADGLIIYIEEQYHTGPGIMIQYSLDIAEKPYGIHDLGVVTEEAIKKNSATTYSVTSGSKVPLRVSVEKGFVRLELGEELYIVSRPSLYRVETGPFGADKGLDANRATIYTVQKNHEERGFLGYERRKWLPPLGKINSEIDYVAKDCPEDFAFMGKTLEATTYDPGTEKPAYWYSYTIPLAKTREVNLMNYLILLTQRCDENDPSYPVIHPVLLTLYYYDALMAKK